MVRSAWMALVLPVLLGAAKPAPRFQTSDRCISCHNELTTPSGKDVSIGIAWRASIMANSSRDPYWQASVRRETIDHPEVVEHIEDECSVCHMPIPRYEAVAAGGTGKIFAHLPFRKDKAQGREASDGVDCSVCHQISRLRLGTRESFNGGFVLDESGKSKVRTEYGPYPVDSGHQRIMRSSTGGFQPVENNDHIRKSELCATCHTLITEAFGPGGVRVGSLPEQVPYQEWLASSYRDQKTCQDCHMPAAGEPVPITRVFGVPREGMKQHTFVAANFFMQRVLNRFRSELEVSALPSELEAASEANIAFLRKESARISVNGVHLRNGRLEAQVTVENFAGHKFPTAFPSRRAWIHFVVRERNGAVLFESGAIRPDGFIPGNDNDEDAGRFEPHYSRITDPRQVQIYEDILGAPDGSVTTGLLTGVRYLKDNRLLPAGFDKSTRDPEIAVVGAAADDPGFKGGSHSLIYSVDTGTRQGPFQVNAELWYQPIGFRWANNLKSYNGASEPRRFTSIYDAMAQAGAIRVASASVSATVASASSLRIP